MNNENIILIKMKHKNMLKLCLSMFLAFMMALPTLAQNITYKGVVVDESGEPIIGASVKVAGTTTGTITDLDGKFQVVVPSGKQVEVSYIGYITQVLTALQRCIYFWKQANKNNIERRLKTIG